MSVFRKKLRMYLMDGPSLSLTLCESKNVTVDSWISEAKYRISSNKQRGRLLALGTVRCSAY